MMSLPNNHVLPTRVKTIIPFQKDDTNIILPKPIISPKWRVKIMNKKEFAYIVTKRFFSTHREKCAIIFDRGCLKYYDRTSTILLGTISDLSTCEVISKANDVLTVKDKIKGKLKLAFENESIRDQWKMLFESYQASL
jgi:hypothetical protein